MHIVRHQPPEGPPERGAAEIRPLVGPEHSAELKAYSATFEPGARNRPHTHSFDQVLYIVAGEGILASGDDEHRVAAGDIVVVPAGEEHWHGAGETGAMTHISFGVPGTTEVDGRPYVPPA